MVVLYSTGCPKCKVLEKKLDMKGIQYQKNNSVMEMVSLGITQVPVLQVEFNIVDEFETSSRGTGGFGSTGKI